MLDFAGFMRIFRVLDSPHDARKAAAARLRTTARVGGHDPRRPGDAARAGAGLDAVPVARPVEHRRTRAHAAHAAHRGRAVRHRIRYRAVAHAGQPAGRRPDRSRSELDRLRAEIFSVGKQRRANRGSCAMCGWSIRCPAPRCRRSTATRRYPVDRLRLRKWNTQSLRLRRCANGLTIWRRCAMRWRHASSASRSQRGRAPHEAPGTHREANISLSLGDDNTLISPVTLFELPDDRRGPPKIIDAGFHDRAARSGDHPRHAADRADHAALSRRRRGGGLPRRGRPEGRPSNVVWESEPGIAASITASPDVTQGFMGPRADQMFMFARNLRDGIGAGHRHRHRLTGDSRAPAEPGPDRDRHPVRAAPGSRLAPHDNIVVSMIEREGRGGAGARSSRAAGRSVRQAAGC